jgi:hypothetical protein
MSFKSRFPKVFRQAHVLSAPFGLELIDDKHVGMRIPFLEQLEHFLGVTAHGIPPIEMNFVQFRRDALELISSHNSVSLPVCFTHFSSSFSSRRRPP